MTDAYISHGFGYGHAQQRARLGFHIWDRYACNLFMREAA